MKKISIGMILFSVFTSNSFAALETTKNDVSIPCYNGGLNFGLAGYTHPLNNTSESNASKFEQAKTPGLEELPKNVV